MSETLLKILASSGQYAILEKDGNLFFVSYGGGWLYTFNWILLLLLFNLFINGIIQSTIDLITGMTLFAGAIIIALILAFGIHWIKKSKKKPLEELNVLAIADFSKKEFSTKNRAIVVPLDTIHFEKIFQINSFSHAIKAKWSGGSITIACGHPFEGESVGFNSVLKNSGLMKE